MFNDCFVAARNKWLLCFIFVTTLRASLSFWNEICWTSIRYEPHWTVRNQFVENQFVEKWSLVWRISCLQTGPCYCFDLGSICRIPLCRIPVRKMGQSLKRASDMSPFPLVSRGTLGLLMSPSCYARSLFDSEGERAYTGYAPSFSF